MTTAEVCPNDGSRLGRDGYREAFSGEGIRNRLLIDIGMRMLRAVPMRNPHCCDCCRRSVRSSAISVDTCIDRGRVLRRRDDHHAAKKVEP